MKLNVLMVCLGNICRSPLAEGILKSKVNPKFITVDSAGTGGYHIGNPPDPRSVAIAALHGVDISKQKCRQFVKADFDLFDYIFVMDSDNYRNVVKLSSTQQQADKVRLLLSEVNDGAPEVPDPYYGDKDGFATVYKLINAACTTIATRLTHNNYGEQS